MYADIKEADGIVAGFPIYFAGINGQSKQWIDRLFPMIASDFSPRYPGKKAVTVYAQGNSNEQAFKAAIGANDSLFKMFGWQIVDSILSCGSNDPQHVLSQDLMDRAYETGRQLVK